MTRLILHSLIILTLMGCSTSIYVNHPNLGQGYKFFHKGKYGLSILNDKNKQVVGSHILEYNFDSMFILVSQRPFNSIPGRDSMTYSELNKVFKSSSYEQYWIIDKTKNSKNIGSDSINQIAKYSNVYGPYTKNEFIQKRNALRVPKELTLKEK